MGEERAGLCVACLMELNKTFNFVLVFPKCVFVSSMDVWVLYVECRKQLTYKSIYKNVVQKRHSLPNAQYSIHTYA